MPPPTRPGGVGGGRNGDGVTGDRMRAPPSTTGPFGAPNPVGGAVPPVPPVPPQSADTSGIRTAQQALDDLRNRWLDAAIEMRLAKQVIESRNRSISELQVQLEIPVTGVSDPTAVVAEIRQRIGVLKTERDAALVSVASLTQRLADAGNTLGGFSTVSLDLLADDMSRSTLELRNANHLMI